MRADPAADTTVASAGSSTTPVGGSTATARRIGVAVMAYGTPASDDELEAYYTDIRRGRPPTAEQLADLRRRYAAIGGLSPLAARTAAQAAAIRTALRHAAGLNGRSGLDGSSGGDTGELRADVAVGYRHAAPSIEDAVATLLDGGADTVVGLVLAPHYSPMSVGAYHARAAAAAGAGGAEFVAVNSWATDGRYVEFLAAAVCDAAATLPDDHRVVFTAHSLPARIVDTDDPYVDELRATAGAVAARLGLPDDRWEIGWQSAGRTPEPWLGPDILQRIDELAGSTAGVLVCPCGFVADHLEVRYDLDIDAAARAHARGLAFARTATVDDDAAVMASLATTALARAGAA